MKIRIGFVSNSSSSSFIVEFPKRPETEKELAEYMGDCSVSSSEFFLSSKEVVNYVWADLQKIKNSKTDSILFPNHDYSLGWNSYDYGNAFGDYFIDYKNEHFNTDDLENYNISETEVLEKFANHLLEIIEKNKLVQPESKFIAKFKYSDDYTIGSALEHGDIFRNLPHERISHH